MKLTWKNPKGSNKKRIRNSVSHFSDLPFNNQNQTQVDTRADRLISDGAEEYVDERGESSSSELNDFQKLSNEFQGQGNKLAEAGNYSEALAKWEAALNFTPENAILHEQKAQILLEIGDAWKALKAATCATELEPSWAEAWITLGRTQLNFGEPDNAIESFDRALAIKPESLEAQEDKRTASHLIKKRKQLHASGLITREDRLVQSLELPQELEQLVCFQDDFALADTSIDPLFHPPQKQPTFISQPHLPTYQDDNPSLVQDFQQQSYSKRRKSFHYSNSNQDDTQINYNETMLACTESFFDGCYGVSSSADSELMLCYHWRQRFILMSHGCCLMSAVAFPPVFFNGTSDRISNNSRSERVGGLSAQSIAARQRRRKIADKTQELGKLIPGGHKMNTSEMFQSASIYVKFLQAQIGMLTLTNSLQEGIKCYGDEEQHLKVLAASPVVQEKLYAQ
ncbi:unnamed protein product [Rhodiola kirilowii]